MKAIVRVRKRKTAVARATITKDSRIVRINSVPVEMYPFELGTPEDPQPSSCAGKEVDSIDIDVNVHGGGVLGASRTAFEPRSREALCNSLTITNSETSSENMTVP